MQFPLLLTLISVFISLVIETYPILPEASRLKWNEQEEIKFRLIVSWTTNGSRFVMQEFGDKLSMAKRWGDSGVKERKKWKDYWPLVARFLATLVVSDSIFGSLMNFDQRYKREKKGKKIRGLIWFVSLTKQSATFMYIF